MFGLRKKHRFCKGIAIGVAIGLTVGAFGVMLGGKERMDDLKRFALKSCRNCRRFFSDLV